MATNFDRALYSEVPPLDVSDGPDAEIEIEEPEEAGIGSIEINLDESKSIDLSDDFYANLAEEIDEGELSSIAGDLME